jgi:hypothetical protein
MFKEQRHLGVRLPSLRLCLTLATAAAEPANRRKSAANGREMEDQVLELQSITRHEELGDGIVEQFSQGRLVIAHVHGGVIPDVLLSPFATTQRLCRPSSPTEGSTVAPYRAESFSVFLDKAVFKTRIGFIVDELELFGAIQAAAGIGPILWPENDTLERAGSFGRSRCRRWRRARPLLRAGIAGFP